MTHFHTQTLKVEQIKSGFHSPIGGIFKYIKSADGFLNQDFFGNEISKPISESVIADFQKIMDTKLQEIKTLKKELSLSDLSLVEKKFLLNTLNITGLKFIMFKMSVYFEAEKFGYTLEPQKRQALLRRVNKLQDIIYGPEISTLESEKSSILSHLQPLLDTNKQNISSEEQNSFQNMIASFHVQKNPIQNNIDIPNLTHRFLSKNTVVQILEMTLELYGLEERTVSVQKVGNFSVQKDKKQILVPEEKVETLSLKRLLQLIDHEIGVHVIRGHNTDSTLKTYGEGYLEGEEGFATLGELLFDNTILEITVTPTLHHISTFIAENYDFVQTKELLEIYYKLSGFSQEKAQKEAEDRTLRVKRFVSHHEKGANRKDVTYTRGQKQILELLQGSEQSTKLISDFYFSKLSLENISLVDEMKQSLGIDENELKYPLWIGKILYKKLSGEKIFLKNLREEDFRFQSVELTTAVKRKIITILSLLK